jgi:sodium/potassium-transporting ATPase subunit alpha
VNKWALAIAKDPDNPSNHLLFMKGAPERILDLCSHYIYNGTERPMDE